jgi:hypothetical protein|tara:strand:+ start:1799 stop:2458 length:660 start_codon:yes stop_codon:yes gene_type:complete
MKMKEIMNEWRKSTKLLNETTFSRIASKIDDQKIPFVVMSADRHEFTRSQNDNRNKELKQAVKASGYPFAELQGSWVEQDEEGNDMRVVEKSIIIYDESRGDVPERSTELFDLGKQLSSEYDQDAYIFGEPGAKSRKMHINAYDRSGNMVDYGGPWSTVEQIPNDSSFWSKVRGTTFVFKEEATEEVVEVDAPNSFIEAMIKTNEHKGKKVKFIRRGKE